MDLNIVLEHSLEKNEALSKVRGLLLGAKKRFANVIEDLHEDWHRNNCDFSFSVLGCAITGNLVVGKSMVRLCGKLPKKAFLFKRKIESIIRAEGEIVLAKK